VTAILFDPGTGRLQLPQAAFDVLVAWARGHEDPGPELLALRDAGAVPAAGGGAHPALAPGLRAVAQPVCRLRVTVTDPPGGLKAGDGWIDPHTAALLLDLPQPTKSAPHHPTPDGDFAGTPGPSELRDFLALPPDFLPAAIARLVRLGPRPRARPEPVPLRAEPVDGLDAADPAVRTRAVAALGEALEQQRLGGPWRAWRAGTTWSGRDGAGLGRRAVQVVDAEPGLFLAESDGEYATLWPTTPTAVWRLLVRLLPDTAELG
jgi:hypothetical protein